jgi:hypothetical protein
MRLILFAVLLVGCAAEGSAYQHARHICSADEQPDGSERVIPSRADVDAVAPLLHLGPRERILYWFESPQGTVLIGISALKSIRAGSSYREVELGRSGGALSVVSETEALCIS